MNKMFKANIQNINGTIDDKIVNSIYVDLNTTIKKNLNGIYINPWKVIKDYVSEASKKRITTYKLKIPKKYKKRFFSKKYDEIRLEFMVIPENQITINDDKRYESNFNNLKKASIASIKNNKFNKKIDNIKINDSVLEDYKFGNGVIKYLAAITKTGNYFISDKDIRFFNDYPLMFISLMNGKIRYDKDNNKAPTKYISIMNPQTLPV